MDDDIRRPEHRPLTNTARTNRLGGSAIRSSAGMPLAHPPADGHVFANGKFKQPRKGKRFSFNPRNFKLPTPKTKKQWIIFGTVTAMILGATGFALYWFVIRDTTPVPAIVIEPEPEPEPEPTTGPSVVSGREVSLSKVQQPIYSVQIENSPEARPQSGLVDADIVTEAVAEGGITRFNAIYHDKVPANIGPVRSMRPYFIDWFLMYNAGAVHAGGSPEALNDIINLKVQDMNHDSVNFRRVSNRYAPHNLYTTGKQMVALFTSKGYKNGKVPSLPRKEPEPAETAKVKTINLNISRSLYNVSFTWDKKSNTYLRTMAGAPHVDADNGKRIAPDVVVIPILTKSNHPNGVHTVYGTTGSGQLFVFQDGRIIKGTWKKKTRQSQWTLLDSEGEKISLNPGQTWFTIMDNPGNVTYAP